MSWVKVKRDNVELTVPYQAFKDVYERDGFKLKENKPLQEPLSNPSPTLEPQKEAKNVRKRSNTKTATKSEV